MLPIVYAFALTNLGAGDLYAHEHHPSGSSADAGISWAYRFFLCQLSPPCTRCNWWIDYQLKNAKLAFIQECSIEASSVKCPIDWRLSTPGHFCTGLLSGAQLIYMENIDKAASAWVCPHCAAVGHYHEGWRRRVVWFNARCIIDTGLTSAAESAVNCS